MATSQGRSTVGGTAGRLDAVLEDFGTKPVPDAQTRSWYQMGLVVWGVSVCIPAFMLGGAVGSMATFWTAFIAIALGSVILAVIASGTGSVGGFSRMSTAMSARFAFGTSANILFALLLAIGAFGWFGIQLEVFGQALSAGIDVVSGGTNVVSKLPLVIVGGILMTSTALVGYKAIEKLSLVVVPLLLILLLVTLVKVVQEHPLSEVAAVAPQTPASLGMLVSVVAGGMAVGAVIMPDISRYSRSSGHAVGGAVFGFLGGFPLFLILAMYLGVATGNGDFTANMLGFHSGLWSLFALFTIVFATWTTNDNNLYSAALALNSIFPKVHKWRVTALAGAAGTILAMLGILSQFMNWMLVLSVSIPPIGAVMAVDFFLFRRHAYDPSIESDLPSVRWQAFASWGFGLLIGLLTYYKVFAFTTAPALDAIIAGSVAYVVVMLAGGARFQVGAAAGAMQASRRISAAREGTVD